MNVDFIFMFTKGYYPKFNPTHWSIINPTIGYFDPSRGLEMIITKKITELAIKLTRIKRNKLKL